MEDKIKLSELAKESGISASVLRNKLNKNIDKLEGHVEKTKHGWEIDSEAKKFLLDEEQKGDTQKQADEKPIERLEKDTEKVIKTLGNMIKEDDKSNTMDFFNNPNTDAVVDTQKEILEKLELIEKENAELLGKMKKEYSDSLMKALILLVKCFLYVGFIPLATFFLLRNGRILYCSWVEVTLFFVLYFVIMTVICSCLKTQIKKFVEDEMKKEG